VSTYQPRLAR